MSLARQLGVAIDLAVAALAPDGAALPNLEPAKARTRLVTIAALLLAFLLPIANPPFVNALLIRLGVSRMAAWMATFTAAEMIALGFILWFVARFERRPLASVGLRMPTLSETALGFALFVALEAFGALVAVVGWSLGYHLSGPTIAPSQVAMLMQVPLLATLLGMSTNGVVEELAARGFAIERLEALIGSTFFAAAIALIADLALHVPFWGYRYALAIAPMQSMFLLVYLWRRNLTAPIVAHILVDAFPRTAAAAAVALGALFGHMSYDTAEGMRLTQLGDYSGAVESLNQAIGRNQADSTAFQWRAYAYRSQGDYVHAIQDMDHVIAVDGPDPQTLSSRADIKRHFGDYAGARSDYEAAVQLDPGDAGALSGLAWILSTSPKAEVRNGRRAVALARKACEKSRWKSDDKLDTLAAAYAEIGDFVQAQSWQKRAIDAMRSSSEDEIKDERERLALYSAGKPYRDNPSDEPG
jgi:membrane protease YdiL (CAAX protease family)